MDTNVKKVLVKFNKGVKLAEGAENVVDGTFRLQATVRLDGQLVDTTALVNIPYKNVDLSQAGDGYVTLEIPDPGIVGKLKSLQVDYEVVSGVKLVSTDAKPAEVNDVGYQSVQLPFNSTDLSVMELQGQITLDGKQPLPPGSIIRADVVQLKDSRLNYTLDRVTATVPNGTGGSYTGLVASLDDLQTKITEAATKGSSTIDVFVGAARSATNAASNLIVSGTLANLGGYSDVYDAKLDLQTGKIVGKSVSGTVTFKGASNQLSFSSAYRAAADGLFSSTTYQVTNDGKFRLSVGADPQRGRLDTSNTFVMISIKKPGTLTETSVFQPITSAVSIFPNYVAFEPNLNTGASIRDLGTINLSKFEKTKIDLSTKEWQVVPFSHKIAVNADAAKKVVNAPNQGTGVKMSDLLVTVDPADGTPKSLWVDNALNDEAFLMGSNQVYYTMQYNGTEVAGNFQGVMGGFALGLKKSDATDVRKIDVYYPIEDAQTPAVPLAGKTWSLVTFETNVDDINSWAAANKVGAILKSGNGAAAKTWFSGQTTNSLTKIAKGESAFVYTGDTVEFKFGR